MAMTSPRRAGGHRPKCDDYKLYRDSRTQLFGGAGSKRMPFFVGGGGGAPADGFAAGGFAAGGFAGTLTFTATCGCGLGTVTCTCTLAPGIPTGLAAGMPTGLAAGMPAWFTGAVGPG